MIVRHSARRLLSSSFKLLHVPGSMRLPLLRSYGGGTQKVYWNKGQKSEDGEDEEEEKKFKDRFKDWWKDPKKRWPTLLGIGGVLILGGLSEKCRDVLGIDLGLYHTIGLNVKQI